MYKFLYCFILFFCYCIFGYVLECAYCSIKDKKVILNRGFLVGPYLPIYGSGAIIIIIFLEKYKKDYIVLFVMACLIATILEYITSYIMEKIFKARWWDYSSRKYNINGRICLSNTLLFGIGGLVITYIINPIFTGMLRYIDDKIIIVIGIIFLIIFLFDIVVSISTIYKLRSNLIKINKDITEEISDQVHKKLLKNKYLKKRLLNAFPDTNDIKSYKEIKEILSIKK